ncbi:PTS fructose transporter subunit EIIC [Klebsiella quasipneumoniae]|nr:PTS fructose transporter subunit EIIC [Klebsiella quasipneumoniae]
MNELVQILKNTRQHLMTGVSHMIPFVVSGGILLAVSVMLYGKGAVPDAATDPNLKKLFDIGVAGLTLMVPFLAAYIGYSIADRAALAPCAIGAWVGNSFGAGFFGALIAGMIGGLVVYYLKKIPVHKVLRSVMPIFIIPIIGTFITAGIMMWGLGEPVGALTANLTGWLQGMREGSIVVLAIIMGLMLAFDMGGPVNKVAYAFMLICVSQGVYSVVAIAAVGIAVPPLGMGLATLIGRKYFTAEERETGKAKGWQVKVETQGSIGIENELTAEEIAAADMVILTKDIGIKFEERFAGKTIVRVNISDAVKRADAIMNKIDSHLSQRT